MIGLRQVASHGFRIGDDVALCGLQAKPELNGQCGKIVAYLTEKERYSVQLADKEINVKPANLRKS